MTDDAFEAARRELCPDGSCVGLIGPDGRCKECGTVAPSAVADPRRQGMALADGDEASAVDDDLDEDRELCPDGACVGLIGHDGRCKVCGTAGTAPAARGPRRPAAVADSTLDEATVDADDDEDRELCPDGSCIGLIGPDGSCKVCGTARSSSP